jgi:hypothetical protein
VRTSAVGEESRHEQQCRTKSESVGDRAPPAPKPLGAYVEAVQVGNLLFVSGALPLEGGVPKFLGRLGADISMEEGVALRDWLRSMHSRWRGSILDRWTRCSASLVCSCRSRLRRNLVSTRRCRWGLRAARGSIRCRARVDLVTSRV